MSNFARDDVVELGAAQVVVVDVTDAPAAPEAFTVSLAINPGDVRDFTYQAQGGETAEEVALALSVVLLAEQTRYSVANGPDPRQVTVVGDVGVPFDVGLTANMMQTTVEQAVRAESGDTGEKLNRVILTSTEGSFPDGFTRETATRQPHGRTYDQNVLRGRELDSGNVFDFEARSVRSRVRPAGPLPFTPGDDGGQAVEGRGGWQAAYSGDELADLVQWPAMRRYGGTPMDLPAAAGVAYRGSQTGELRREGIGDARLNQAALGASSVVAFAQGGPTGPSRLVDVSALPAHHQRYVVRPPALNAVGGVRFGQAREAAQELTLSLLLPPFVPDALFQVAALDSLAATYGATFAVPPDLLDGRWWLADVQLAPGNPGQIHLFVNGRDLTGNIPPSAAAVPAFAGRPALSLLNTTAPGNGAQGALLLFAGFAWRAAPLGLEEHYEDALACGTVP